MKVINKSPHIIIPNINKAYQRFKLMHMKIKLIKYQLKVRFVPNLPDKPPLMRTIWVYST